MGGTQVIVIGGGASGLMAAISAVRDEVNVTLVEAAAHVGKPILATGNGRCNLTNTQVAARDYNHPEFVKPVLARYGAEDVLSIFAGLGLLATGEEDGRVYPLSRTASSVVDVLRNAAARLGVRLVCGVRARALRPTPEGFRVLVDEGAPWDADAVVVATGGGTDLLSALGHRIEPFEPVLCSLATATEPLRGLDGVRAEALVRAFRPGADEPFAQERGEVLFRKYGLSGIVIFDLSRQVGEADVLSLDLLPDMPRGDAEAFLRLLLDNQNEAAEVCGRPAPTYGELIAGVFHPRVATAVLRNAGLKPSAPADEAEIPELVRSAKDFRVEVTGIGDARHAQVTRGGADVSQFDPETLESRLVPGLFACGETLDVDGPCGGYNLQWAWASGLVAGNAASRK